MGVHQADDTEGAGKRFGLGFDAGADVRGEAVGGQGTGAIAGMHACFFDVFHQPTDNGGFAVADNVDIDFDGVIEEAVKEDGGIRRDVQRVFHVIGEIGVVVDDIHGAATQDV